MPTPLTQSNGMATTVPQAVTTQGTVTPAGTVNYDPNTGQKLATGQSVAVAPGGNTYGSTPQVSTTTVSNANKINQVPGIVNTTNTLANTGISTNATGTPVYSNGTIVPRSITSNNSNADGSTDISYSDGTTEHKAATAPSAVITDSFGMKGTQSAGGYVGETYYAPGDTVPLDVNGNPQTLSVNSPTHQSTLDTLDKLQSQSDSVTTSLIQNIKDQYDTLIRNTQTTLAGQQSGIQNALLNGGVTGKGGSSQYAPISSSGIISSQIAYGAQQIADLQTKENSAIISAQQAQLDNNFKLAASLNEEISKIRSEKQDAAKALNDKILTQNQKLQDQAYQQKQATTTAIDGILKDAADNGITDPAVLSAISKSTTLEGAIAAAGGGLQKMTGDFADYPQYKKDALANGVVPESATAWLAKKQVSDAKLKSSEAYGTAYNTAKGKAAGEAAATGGPNAVLPVTSSNGITYSVPAAVAPYVKISESGVKYVDASGLSAAEKGSIIKAAFNGGVNPIPVITDPGSALDVNNITDATLKLKDMKDAFDGNTAESASQRNLYYSAAQKVATELQTDPNVVGLDIYQDAALDILKAMSGTKGFKGGSAMVDSVKQSFPKSTDTQAVVNQKIANMQQLIDDRQTGLIGKPSVSDQAIIDQKNVESNITTNLNNIKTTDPTTYNAASQMFVGIDPGTGQPYSVADILKIFPQLSQ